MRHSRNIFENEGYRGRRGRRISAVTLVTLILSMVSVVAGIYIIVNFGVITAKIAIGTAHFLCSGFPILLVIASATYLIMRFKWRLRGRFWRR